MVCCCGWSSVSTCAASVVEVGRRCWRVLSLVARRVGRGGGRSSAGRRRRSRASAVVIRERPVRKATLLDESAPSRVEAARQGIFVILLLVGLCWRARDGVAVCRRECLRNPTRRQLW